MAERDIDTDQELDRKHQKQGTGIQAATDTRDQSIVMREEGGAVNYETPGPGFRKEDKHDLPLHPGPINPPRKKTTIVIDEAQLTVKTEGGYERKGSDRLFNDMDDESFAVLNNAVRAGAGVR